LRGDSSIEDFQIFKFLIIIIIIIINGLFLTISSAALTDHEFIFYKSHVQKIFLFNSSYRGVEWFTSGITKL